MKRVVLISVLVLIYLNIIAQQNGVFVSNVRLINNSEKWCWAFEQDDQHNMFIGISKGVVVYDGVNQSVTKVPFTPLAMKYEPIGSRLWVAGYEQFGYLTSDDFGNYEYKHLSNTPEENYQNIEYINDTIYFISEQSIILVDAKTDSIIIRKEFDEKLIEKAFIYNNELLTIIDYFVYRFVDDELVEALDIEFPVDEYSYVFQVGENLLLGTMSSTYYLYNGADYIDKEFYSKSFFKNNLIVSGLRYNDSLVVLSSLAGGIAIVNTKTNRIIKEANYYTGLPDDEIRALFIDDELGIWVSHEFGVSRIDLNTGAEYYNFYPGLKGNPIAVEYYNNELYVATNDGLFILDEIKNYNEVSIKIKVPTKRTPIVKKKETVVPKVEPIVETEKKELSRKEKRRLKKSGGSSKATPAVTVIEEKVASTKPVKKRKANTTVTRTIKQKRLKSVSHGYRMVDGVNDKCRQLDQAHGYLLAAGNNGLYIIKDKKANVLINDVYVFYIYVNNENDMFCCTNNGLYKLSYTNSKWKYEHFYQTTYDDIYSLTKESGDTWVMTINNSIKRFSISGNEIKEINSIMFSEEAGEDFFAKHIDDETLIFTKNNIYRFDDSDQLIVKKELSTDAILYNNQANYSFVYNNGQWKAYSSLRENIFADVSVQGLNLGAKPRYVSITDDSDVWIVDENNLITKFNTTNKVEKTYLQMNQVSAFLDGQEIKLESKLNLPASMRNLRIGFSAPFYVVQNGVEYCYKVEGFYDEWSPWSNSSEVSIQHLPAGNYVIKVHAKDIIGNESEIFVLPINVKKPFTQTLLFYLLLVAAFIVLAIVYSKYRLKVLEKDKQILEKKVKERTFTIETQKNRIEKQHSEINSSIRYAQRIQKAMLPLDEIMEAMLPKHFVLFMPRDIVSGDFYFFKPIDKYIAFIAADCTGHGVPGGFMSMLGISYLNEITSQIATKDASAAEVINRLRDKIKMTLGQTDINSTQKDGMDLSICLIDTEKKQLQFSGAFNPLLIIRDNKLDVVKGDRQPVSVYYNEHEFTNHIIDVQPGDKFYMFSDGYPDQIGGPKERKFMSKRFKELLLEIHNKPMEKQAELLKKEIVDWQGELMQVDDILVVGFEV